MLQNKAYLSKESKILLKIFQQIKKNNIIFSGKIPDSLFYTKKIKNYTIYAQKYDIFNKIKKSQHQYIKEKNLEKFIKNQKYTCLIYFWPKNKKEAKFQLLHIMSYVSKNILIYIVGKKKSGVNSINNILKNYLICNILKKEKHCILYQAKILQQKKFYVKKFFKNFFWNNIYIKCLPGVFGFNGIDNGSKLLISTFDDKIEGDVLDLGCGAGILSTALYKKSSKVNLHLTDICYSAILSSHYTLLKNKVHGKVYISNLYSNIKKKFNLIISNPPIHDDLKKSYFILNKITKKSTKYLKNKGEIRIVVQSNIKSYFFLKNNYKILKKNLNYTIYQKFKKKKI